MTAVFSPRHGGVACEVEVALSWVGDREGGQWFAALAAGGAPTSASSREPLYHLAALGVDDQAGRAGAVRDLFHRARAHGAACAVVDPVGP